MTNKGRITQATQGIDSETRAIRREIEAFECFHERVRLLQIDFTLSEQRSNPTPAMSSISIAKRLPGPGTWTTPT